MSISFLRGCFRRVCSVLSGFAFLIFLTAPSCAQETEGVAKEPTAEQSVAEQETEKPAAENAGAEKTVEEKPDPFAIPEEGDAETYLKFIDDLQREVPTEAASQEEYNLVMTKIQRLMLEAAKRGFAQQPDDQQTVYLLEAKVIGIINLYALGEIENPKEAISLLESYADDERELVASFARKFVKRIKLKVLNTLSDEERKAFVDETLAGLEKSGVTRFNFMELYQTAQVLENIAPVKEAIDYYRKAAELAAQSSDENIVKAAADFQAVIRRLELPGNTMDLFGKTTTGDEFHWKDYRGKVVLVDFWATWCALCIQELPNIKANYEKYHDLGFEIVGVNLDENLFQVERFVESRNLPWVQIFPEEVQKRGWEHPLATHYGVKSLPTTILIDQEGKVVKLNVFGPELGVQLQKLLGQPKSE